MAEVEDVERGEEQPEPEQQEAADPDLVLVQEVDKDGKQVKMVPLEALHGAREELKRHKETIAKLEPLMPEFDEFLQSKRQPKQAPQPKQTGLSDEELEEIDGMAQVYGFVDPTTGEVDRVRTIKAMQIMDRRNARQVQRYTRPLVEDVATTRARDNREQAYDRMFDDGRPVAEREYIDKVYDSLAPEHAADPTIAGVAHLIAAGLQALDERKGREPVRRVPEPQGDRPVRFRQREPMFVEGSTRRSTEQDEELSGFSRAAAAARGKTPEQWAKQRTKVAGRRNPDILDDGF